MENKNIEDLLDRWGEGNMSVQDLSDELYVLFDVSGSLPSQDFIELLRECRDLLVMCTVIDKYGHCKSLVDKVDTKMGW